MKTRIKRLEKSAAAKTPRRVIVCRCWTMRSDGGHNPDCPTLAVGPNEAVDIFEVHYVEWPPDGSKN